MTYRWFAVLLLIAGADQAHAQLVRGRVTERVTNAPLPGVVVEVLSDAPASSGMRLGSTLSSVDGSYAIRLPVAGSVRVTAKRIGVRRLVSEAFVVGTGETVERHLVVEALSTRLQGVTVLGLTTCSGDAREGARVAALWDEARTALYATQISLRDTLFRADVTRYVRELDPRTRGIVNETRSQSTGVVSRPFTAVSAESLSASGYWRSDDGRGYTYFGPDADVLLSEAFVRDHCFREARRGRDRRGLTGIRFEPTQQRNTPDITGVLWLDERSSELRFVEFGYSPPPPGVDSVTAGGEVHFARMPSGAWIIRRWFIRLPVVARPMAPLASQPSAAPWVLVRPVTLQLREEGGDVSAESLVKPNTVVTLRGTIRDSSDRPLAGARVTVAGTRRTGISGPTGAFTIDSVPFGSWSVIADVDGYDALGLVAAEQEIAVSAEAAPVLQLRAINARLMYPRVCAGELARYGYGAIRISVRATGDSIVQGLPVALSWVAVRNRSQGIEPGPRTRDFVTDAYGRVTLCTMDAGLDVSVVVARRGGGSEPVHVVRVPDRGVAGVQVLLSPTP